MLQKFAYKKNMMYICNRIKQQTPTNMETALVNTQNQDISAIFQQRKNEIRKIFCQELSEIEFEYFAQMAIKLGANPFLREIFALKRRYRKEGEWVETLSIFCGRDFYRRKAQEQEIYDGHITGVVYENDAFEIKNGIINHTANFKNRGKIIGAYASVYRKDTKIPITTFVYMHEYDTKMGTWVTKPHTMIEKVAESQAFRKAFQGIFAGTYDESEKFEDEGTESTERTINVAKAAPQIPAERFEKALIYLQNVQQAMLTDNETQRAQAMEGLKKAINALATFSLTDEQIKKVADKILLDDEQKENLIAIFKK